MLRANPILVTGSHRSGSTWVGQMLSAAPAVGYIREPFSVLHRPGILEAEFPYWFPYVCAENEGPYVNPVREMLGYRYKIRAALAAVRTPADAVRVGNDLRTFAGYRRARARPLLKDPIAVFSAQWLAERFGMDVIVQVRHPAAFVSSLKKYGWTHPFGDFLAQPLLMRDLLGDFEGDIREFAASPRPPVEQAILLWRLIHHAIAGYRDRHPTWLFYRHEDVAMDPLGRFEDMYGRLGLDFTTEARATIAEFTDPSNPAEATDDQTLRRDSRSSIWTWKSRLTAEEIDRVRANTEPIWKEFYTDDDW
jgi:hypothetical protein